MLLPWTLIVSLFVQQTVFGARPIKRSYHTYNYYVLEHDPRASARLMDVAKVLGVEVVEQAGELQNHWLVRAPKPDLTSRSNDPDPIMQSFNDLRRRADLSSRSHIPHSEDVVTARAVVSSVRYFSRQTLRTRIKRAPPPVVTSPHTSAQEYAARFGIADPLFTDQWHLVNDDYPEHTLNVIPVWEMGVTGKGVISSLVDDGLDYTSEDLSENFDEDDSYDFNDHEPLPTPKKSDDRHGTRCAGQVAAGKNNACGLGIAYESKVAGVRILSGPISDVDEAAALNYGFQNVSIYSCSWGPPDNGQAMEGPSHLIKKAVVNGVNNGRGGKGSIFVFASGNGAANGDQCNFDGYTNSIYSVTISAVDYKGLHPYYSEPCAANMVVAYSSGSGKHIVTTDKGKNTCTKFHGGTSAAAPNAVGVFALALQVRPDLTWRDIQYLCVEHAKMINPEDPDWEKTAAGRLYSYKYGFGVLDAHKYVTAAQTWKLVKPQAWFETPAIQLENGTMLRLGEYSGGQFIGSGGVESSMMVTKEMFTQNNLESLEHINVKVWIRHDVRGDVEVEIVSPNGIRSILARKRHGDRDRSGYPGWMFMSVKHWGENPVGNWTIKVSDQNTQATSNGTFLGWNMIFWGTTIDPSKARKYEVPLVENVLPVHIEVPTPETPTTTKILTKPTAQLPGDHGTAPGENTNPAFSSVQPAATSTTTPNPTADEGWFPSMSNLVTNQKWFFGVVGLVALFGLGMGFFFWRRRRTRQANYSSLPANEEMSMSALLTGHRTRGVAVTSRPTKELYDAFGEVSDEDEDGEDEDEGKALRTNPRDRISSGLGFNSGFLDDHDEPPTAGSSMTPKYRDEPEGVHSVGVLSRGASPSGTGESWEHASSSA